MKYVLKMTISIAAVFSRWGAFSSVVEWSSVGTSTAEHEVANHVIKYLRWRNSDGSGMVAAEFIGVAFDVADPLSTTVEYCELVLGDRGQGGYRLSHTAVCSRVGQ